MSTTTKTTLSRPAQIRLAVIRGLTTTVAISLVTGIPLRQVASRIQELTEKGLVRKVGIQPSGKLGGRPSNVVRSAINNRDQ